MRIYNTEISADNRPIWKKIDSTVIKFTAVEGFTAYYLTQDVNKVCLTLQSCQN